MADDKKQNSQADAGATSAAGAGAPASGNGGGDAPAAPSEPERGPLHVVHDMLATITGMLGNNGALEELLLELRSLL